MVVIQGWGARAINVQDMHALNGVQSAGRSVESNKRPQIPFFSLL